MAHKTDYVTYPVVAYRVSGEDGWRFGEALQGVDSFTASLAASGVPAVEMRSLFEQTKRTDLREAKCIDPDWLLHHGWSWDEPWSAWRAPEEPIRAPSVPANLVEDIVVRFDPALWGWQPVRLEAGGKCFEWRATDIWDPFPDLVQWLEMIVEGGTGRVICDVEGWFVEFHALPADDAQRARIVVTTQSPGRRKDIRDLELDIDIDRLRFAHRFYGALRSYAESDRYIAEHWASLTLAEDLVRRGLEGDPAAFADRPSGALKETLRRLYPEYRLRFPAAAADDEELVRFKGYPDKLLRFERRSQPQVGKPDAEFVIPGRFDVWTSSKRHSYIQEFLETYVSTWLGSDLRTLRSKTLDAVLDLLRE